MLLAESGVARKTVSMKLGTELLPEGVYTYPERFSPEYLLQDCSEHPSGLFNRDEFSGFLMEGGRQYMSGVKEDLMCLYDHTSFTTATLKRGVTFIRDPYFTLLTGTTPMGLLTTIEWRDIETGFMPRFLTVSIRKDEVAHKPIKIKPRRGFRPMTLKVRLNAYMENAARLKRLHITQRVMDHYNRLDEALKHHNQGNFYEPFVVRYSLSALKIAILSAVERNSKTVEISDIDRGFAFVMKLLPRVPPLISDILRAAKIPVGVLTTLIGRHVSENPGCTRSTVMRIYGVSQSLMTGIEKTLINQNKIVTRERSVMREIDGVSYNVPDKIYYPL